MALPDGTPFPTDTTGLRGAFAYLGRLAATKNAGWSVSPAPRLPGDSHVRTIRPIIAAAIIAAIPSILVIRSAAAQGPMISAESSAMTGSDVSGDACGCRNVQQPPWHANVHGAECGPACHHCGVFHANPCGQLHPRQHLHQCQPLVMPPCFPRLHAMWAYGSMPAPRPLAQPRCHQCGAVIEGGF